MNKPQQKHYSHTNLSPLQRMHTAVSTRESAKTTEKYNAEQKIPIELTLGRPNEPYLKRGPTMTMEKPLQINAIDIGNSAINDSKESNSLGENVSVAEENNISKEKPYRHIVNCKFQTRNALKFQSANSRNQPYGMTATPNRVAFSSKYNMKTILGIKLREAAENGELSVVKLIVEGYWYN
jgi:hypothetical protein